MIFCELGCQTAQGHPHSKPRDIEKAQALMEAGEWYQARKRTEIILKKRPKDEEAERLMAEILEREIARHKEIMETGTLEELSQKEKESQARTWLERGRAMMESRQYDQALEAAEQVFLYDPDNPAASELIDQIKRQARKEGKKEVGTLRKMYRDEIQSRVQSYRELARDYMKEGRWGPAQVTVSKLLLLAPEDGEALKMQKKVKEHLRGQQAA